MAGKLKQGAETIEQLLALGFTHELQPDGSYRWYTVHPKTGERVEIDPAQVWFWTEEWQAKEREADADLETERYEEFDDMDDFLDSL
jgi:hypothetical protein